MSSGLKNDNFFNLTNDATPAQCDAVCAVPHAKCNYNTSKCEPCAFGLDPTEDELADHCASYGSVGAAELLTRGRNNRPSGSAIVEYSADHEAKAAIAGLEGQELGGRPLRVREYYSA